MKNFIFFLLRSFLPLPLSLMIGLQSSQWTRKEEDYITSYHSTQEEAVDAIKAEAEKHAPSPFLVGAGLYDTINL